jgi:hypothetical protein
MANDILIDREKRLRNESIPPEVKVRRFAVATNILATVRDRERYYFLLVNSDPKIYNQWFSFYTTENDFYDFRSRTYEDLVAEFEDEILRKNEINGIQDISYKFKEEFNLSLLDLQDCDRDEYWLKYSKSANVWTLYLFRFFYVVRMNRVESFFGSLNENKVLAPLADVELKEILANHQFKGLPIVENIWRLLSDSEFLRFLKETATVR